MPDAEQQELLIAFVEEGNELLDESEPLIIELESRAIESGKVDYEMINTIFRLFHSLKGGAGFLDLKTVGKVTHEAETLLDLFRKSKGTIRSEHIDILNQTCDFLRKLLSNIESSLNDEGFEDEADGIIATLSGKISEITGESNKTGKTSPEGKSTTDVTETNNSESQVDTAIGSKNQSEQEAMDLLITPEMMKQFMNESEDLLNVAEEAFLTLDKEPESSEQINEAFRALHSFKGNAGFLGYEDLQRISHQAETILDKVRLGEITGNSELYSLLLDILDFLRCGLNQLEEGKEPEINGADGLIHLMQDTMNKFISGTAKQKESTTASSSNKTVNPEMDTDFSTVSTSPKPAAEEKTPLKKPGGPKKLQPKISKPAVTTSVQRQSIRVDVEKLEILLDLVGELVIAEAMVAQNPDLKGLDISLDRFEKSVMHLNKITRDLQDVSTSIRMIPLSGTFRRMIRLVRDLAQKTGKRADLELIGEGTEVDKTVIEKITDPLVHIIRNSIDHGIGTPDSRKSSGKPETGHVILEAKYVGGEVWVSIIDDGMGLNREKILEKAMEKGLVEGDGSDLENEQVWQLIFQPGFSTADMVTDVSGRGVGMDVVRRNIENIRGKVDVKSTPGVGSEVILKIPLTLAIIDGMIIRVGKNQYIIPIVSIKETLRIQEKDITHTMDGAEIVKIRENLYPVVRLHEFYEVAPMFSKLSEGIIMIVENSGKRFCLFVDELIGQQQVVIKGLSGYIGHLKAISGCTILGDGTVCLIIDIAGLAEVAETCSQTSAEPPIVNEVENVTV